MNEHLHESFIKKENDPLIRLLNKVVVYCVKAMAILMVLGIIWGLLDVVMHTYRQFEASLYTQFTDENLITLLGSFLAVLIAIEIFMNIVFYLKQDAVHVPLVLSTALTAVARKVILLDYNILTSMDILATASVIFAVGIIYWLLIKKSDRDVFESK